MKLLLDTIFQQSGYKDRKAAISALKGLPESTPAERLLLRGLEAQEKISEGQGAIELLKFARVTQYDSVHSNEDKFNDFWRQADEMEKAGEKELQAVELELTSSSIALLDLHNFNSKRQNS